MATYTEAQVKALVEAAEAKGAAAAKAAKKTLTVEYRDPSKTYTYKDKATGQDVTKPGSGVFMLKGLRQMPQSFYKNEWATLRSERVGTLLDEAFAAHPDCPTK